MSKKTTGRNTKNTGRKATNREQYNKRKNRKEQAKKERQRLIFVIIAVSVLAIIGGLALALSQNDKEATEPKEETAAAVATPGSDYERVINRSHPIPEDYIAGTGTLATVEGDIEMETQAAEAAKKMVSDLRGEGMDIIVQSGYRSDQTQENLYQAQIDRHNGDELEAGTISAVPLSSEHQAGLAVDFSVDGNLDAEFASTPQGQWLNEHCWEYGYILRYIEDKVEFTGIVWEPWHFRYVGSPEVAKAITQSGQCMEEYYGTYLDPEDLDPYLPYLENTQL